MIIRYGKDNDETRSDTFEAFSDTEEKIGQARVDIASCPMIWANRPCWVTIHEKGDEEAMDALLGAATAYAFRAAQNSGKNACIRLERSPEQRGSSMPEALGFTLQSALVRMRMPVGSEPIATEIPEGLTFVRDYLLDEQEREYYLERCAAMFGTPLDGAWLDALREKDNFARILLLDEKGAAGEMITWSEGKTAMVAHLWVHPERRRKGVGRFLLELGRIYWADKGLQSVCMDVWNRLLPAMRLSASAGFTEIGTVREYLYMDVDQSSKPVH